MLSLLELYFVLYWKLKKRLLTGVFIGSQMPLFVQSNPKGAERLPPGIVAAQSDLYLRRLWGLPSEVCGHAITSQSNLHLTLSLPSG